MKKNIVTLAFVFIAASPLAWAQEDMSPMPTVTPSEKSEPTTADPSVSITTERSSTPTPSKSSSPAARAKTPSPAAKTSSISPKSATSPAPTASTKKMSPDAALRDLENRWEAATASHDSSVTASLLADDYVGVNSKGKTLNRSALISEIKKDKDTYTSAKNGRMDVRLFGPQFAVVTGTSTEGGKDKDGKAFSRTYRWTDVWVDRKGKWQCVSSHANLVSK
jgi:uncharacterized protein (TIGR02246 family)